MEYELTSERDAYLNARGFTILAACPGSGKTTSIVMKLHELSNYCREHYGKHSGFASLSFTNKACDELKCKYLELHDKRIAFPNLVSTIDSFILQKVVLPFWYLCDVCKKRPIVLNEESLMEKIYYVNDEDRESEYVAPILRKYSAFIRKIKPSDISRDCNGYTLKHRSVTDPSEIACCKAVFEYRLERGFINSHDALWMALEILKGHPVIAKALVSKFPYIISDEAQDNSELHFAFFDVLRDAGLQHLEFVGDICQSIYGFNNARPELLQERMNSGKWNVLPMTDCRRSNQRIIDLYSKLKSNDVPKIKSHGVKDLNIPIVVYKYAHDNTATVINDFNKICDDNDLKSRKVLARSVNMCKNLSGISDTAFRYWKNELPYLVIGAKLDVVAGDMNAAFRKVRLTLADLKGGRTIDDRREYLHKIEHDISINGRIYAFLEKIPSFGLSFRDWSQQTCNLLVAHWGLAERPMFVAYEKQKGCKMKVMANKPVEMYHHSVDKNSIYYNQVDTIHSVKGASLDGVLLFLSKDSRGQYISLNDFPKFEIKQMTEKQRMIYVACSRARQFLALAVPCDVSDEQIRQSLSGVNVEIRNFSS